ncbi:hypothetical protein CCC_03377 [Paramagnetospirillum magnetotacticum MS-1]|uniref:Uncharacterized protein n=1 Tax=Paramagnetospirillum magnetotacticum MS-1 TaxID=272627 RepID=A0A0C2YHI4_PARME|nr:hypothetical protein CCC_03377 [Paramagnetospirillum magnetotacticum MS-1]
MRRQIRWSGGKGIGDGGVCSSHGCIQPQYPPGGKSLGSSPAFPRRAEVLGCIIWSLAEILKPWLSPLAALARRS